MSLVRRSSMREKKIAANQENRSPSLGPLTAEGKEHNRAPLVCHIRRGTWPMNSPGSYVNSLDPRTANRFCRCRAWNDPTRVACGVLSMPLGGLKGNCSRKKMLKKAVRSRNVYENNRNSDRMPDAKSDIFGDMTRFLQKKAAYDAQLEAVGHRSDYRERLRLVAANGQRPGKGERDSWLHIYVTRRYRGMTTFELAFHCRGDFC